MINVVFLLLIFFLIAAQIAPPDPVEVALPAAEAGEAPLGQGALYLSKEGDVAFRNLRGAAAIAAALAELDARGEDRLELRADAGVAGALVAKLVAELTAAGVSELALVTAVE